MNKITKNKLGKGLVSLITIIVLLSSILATTTFYENNITGNIVKKFNAQSVEFFSEEPKIEHIEDIKELNQLNEGWYNV